ncbi:hypothetical protein [Pseudomonas sp. LRF_L74]|uniref:hypothetical protein n=1 Tax=Pseudomonas sp. LRF_L74 TaxID=3369422 RepID=UPI003F5F122E
MTLHFESFLGAIDACGPDARFLLEVIATEAEHRRETWREFGVKSFAKHLHLDESVVSAALSELVAAGTLERLVATRVGRGGRAAVTYKLSQGNEAELRFRSYPLHAELLQALFSGADMAFAVLGSELGRAGKPEESDEPGEEGGAAKPKSRKRPPPGGRGRLSIRNRLLLAVLLSRSDRFGEVQISLSELALCAGMPAERVKNRLARLMAVGLIRRCVPGLSSLIFKAGRISSTYFLNLEIFGAGGAVAVHVDFYREEKRHTHMDLLCGSVSHFSKTGRFRNSKAPKSVLIFLRGERPEVFPLLQHLLNGYASQLLSRHWDALGSEVLVEDPEVVCLIGSCFRCPSSELVPGGSFNEVCEYFYSLAIDVAREYRGRFGQANWVDFASVDIRILPAVENRGYEAITVLLRSAPRRLGTVAISHGLGKFIAFDDVGLDCVTICPERSEADLSLQRRWEYGLITLPDKVTKAWAQ